MSGQHLSDLKNRYRGALLGLAVGDAVGTTLEFKETGTFQPIWDMLGGGPFDLNAGEWTDDTSMALCLASSLIERGGFDPDDQMRRYARWWQEGYLSATGECFDIGNTVRSALKRYLLDGNPYAGSTASSTAGNGSLMRLAPVPLYFASDPRNAILQAGLSSKTTHAAQMAIDACRYFAGLILGALQGRDRQLLLSADFSPVPGLWQEAPLDPSIAEIAAGSFQVRQPPQIRGTGFVVSSLEAALWAFDSTSDFQTGCLAAANLGDDADTTAAIYGQLAGAYYGESGIPAPWLECLAERELITDLADRLMEAAYPASGQAR
jgi:ADP-ribosylglycohydrolase